jgi:ubiquinone/menaquinone biosynthesis C-methylase UbiE
MRIESTTDTCEYCGRPLGYGHEPQCAVLEKRPKQELSESEQGYGTSKDLDRSLEEYVELTGIPIGELRGESVLDIGSGGKESFSKQAAEQDVKITSLNPALKDEAHRSLLKDPASDLNPWQKRSAAGLAQELPFADNTFKAEVGLYSLTNYWHFPEDYDRYNIALRDIVRTLSQNGKAYMYPLWPEDYNHPLFHKLQESLKSIATVEVVPLPNEDEQVAREVDEFLSPTASPSLRQQHMDKLRFRRLVITKI